MAVATLIDGCRVRSDQPPSEESEKAIRELIAAAKVKLRDHKATQTHEDIMRKLGLR